MEEEWLADGLDEALASAAALAEGSQSVSELKEKLVIDISSDEADYASWNRAWETQNLQNELFSDGINPEGGAPMVSYGQPWQSLDLGSISTNDGCEYGHSSIHSSGASNKFVLELPECIRGPGDTEKENSNSRLGDVHYGVKKTNKRRVLGELHSNNEPVHKKTRQEEVPKEKESVGQIPTGSILSAGEAFNVRWRNGVFNGRSLRELYNHCNGVLSSTNQLIHDVLSDRDGRRVDLLLERLSTTRKANGLWLVSLHRRDGVANQLVLPRALPSRAESIEVAKLINSDYGHGVDRHAHIIHICPWASNYCRCKPLQGLPIKRQSRPSRRAIGERHFTNLVEYLLRNPRQLCVFEVGCSPVHTTLPSGKYTVMSYGMCYLYKIYTCR